MSELKQSTRLKTAQLQQHFIPLTATTSNNMFHVTNIYSNSYSKKLSKLNFQSYNFIKDTDKDNDKKSI